MTDKKLDIALLKDYVFNEYFFSNPDKLKDLVNYIKKDIENTSKIEESDVFVSQLKKVLASAQNIQTVDSYKTEMINKNKE